VRSGVCAPRARGAPAEVWRAHGLTHPLGDKHRGFLDLIPSRITPEQVDQAASTMTPDVLLTLMYAGSAEQICDEVAPLANAGCTHFILANSGASFTGDGARTLWRLADLTRRLRRL
jgi:phthiodiolone/phenolphthiodiolone dimycocerosates ketoreductase